MKQRLIGAMNQSQKSPGRSSLFWRLWWRALSVKRPQAALAIVALLVGAAVTAMLLSLYGDVRRKMTQEFRAYGANAVLAPASPEAGKSPAVASVSADAAELMDEAAVRPLAAFLQGRHGLAVAPILYAVVRLARILPDPRLPEFENVVAVGTDFAALRRLNKGWRAEGSQGESGLASGTCAVGAHLAARLRVHPGDSIRLGPATSDAGAGQVYRIASVLSTGAAEDDQVFLRLLDLQSLVGMPGKISLVELDVAGEAAEIERTLHELRGALAGVEVRPIRQIVYSEGRVLGTIRWLLLSVTALILIIIALCVMATMTAIVLERRKDIGVMKALGADDPLVMRLFLAESAGLGLVGGLGGFLLGNLLAYDLLRRLFGVPLHLNWWTLPVVSGLATLLAVLAALFPVRIVRGIQPAAALKGE